MINLPRHAPCEICGQPAELKPNQTPWDSPIQCETCVGMRTHHPAIFAWVLTVIEHKIETSRGTHEDRYEHTPRSVE